MRNPKFLGVYSLKNTGKRGREGRIPSWFVWRLPNGNYAIQELDQALTAKGPASAVKASDFDSAFKLEPSILAAPVTTPDFSIFFQAPGGEKRDAEFEALQAARAARQIENDMRGSFEKALKAVSRPRDRKAALASLTALATAKKGIVASHKHMFRDFGVSLRKKSLLDLALTCADRAVKLAPQDDHARFNYARLLGMAGRFKEAEKQLGIAIKIDPSEKVYARLQRHLDRERQFAQAKDDKPGS